MSTMGLYEIFVLVHIAAAVALLGGSVIASPGVRLAIRRARSVQDVRAHLAIGHPLFMLEPISAIAVLVSGVYLTNVAHFWTQGWVQVAIAAWVLNSLVAAAVVKPAIGRLTSRAAAAADGSVGQDLDAVRWSSRWSYGGDVLMANDAAMLYLMTMKPGLAASLLVVALVNIVVAAIGAGSRFRRPRVATDVALRT